MVEFTPMETPEKNSKSTFITAGVVLVLLVVGIFAFIQYQKSTAPRPGASGIAVPNMLHPGNTDFEYYKSKILIENVEAVLQISFNQVRAAKISGTIVNDGDRKLDALELHITLYDNDGKISRERTALALRPKADKPLAPLGRHRFTIGADAVEENWNPEQIAYEITGLRYE